MVSEEELVIEFEVPVEPTLANDMYKAVKSKRNGWAVMAKSNGFIKYQKHMESVLPEILPEEKIARFRYLFSTGVYDIKVESIHYVPYERFYNFDASNLIKAYEDCIARHLKIDDSFTSRYEVEKIPTVSQGWLIKTRMQLVPRNPLTIKI